eukprot:g13251.t1
MNYSYIRSSKMARSLLFSVVPSLICLQAFSIKTKDPLERFRKQYRDDEDKHTAPAASAGAAPHSLLFPNALPTPPSALDRFRMHYDLPQRQSLSSAIASSLYQCHSSEDSLLSPLWVALRIRLSNLSSALMDDFTVAGDRRAVNSWHSGRDAHLGSKAKRNLATKVR